jgi:hypothetical protein
MKKQVLQKLWIMAAIVAVVFAGCGGKKKATSVAASSSMGTEVLIPCSDMEFHSDRTHFRGTGMADGVTMASVRRRANLDANAALAASINRTIKSVSDRYTQDITVGNRNEFAEKFEDMTRSVVDQSINNVSTVCSRVFEKDGKYSVYVAVEVAKDEFLKNLSSSISNDARLRLDYDKMKFEQIFNEEMDRLSNERR